MISASSSLSLVFKNLYRILGSMMDVMLSFLLQVCVTVVLSSSLKFRSFSCLHNHEFRENLLFVLKFQILLRFVLFFHLELLMLFVSFRIEHF